MSFWCLRWLKQKFNYELNFNRKAVLHVAPQSTADLVLSTSVRAPLVGTTFSYLTVQTLRFSPGAINFWQPAKTHFFFPYTHVISRLGDPRIDPSTLLTSSRQYYVMVAWILYSDQNHFLGTRHSFILIWRAKLELFAWNFSKIW